VHREHGRVVVGAGVPAEHRQHPVARLAGRADGPRERPDQAVEALGQRGVALLDEPVGVEHEHRVRRQLHDLVDVPATADAERPAGLDLEQPRPSPASATTGGRWPAEHTSSARCRLEPRDEAGREVQLGTPCTTRSAGQHLRRAVAVQGVRAHRRLQLAHHGRGLHPAAHDVADDEHQRVVELDDVVPVTADLRAARTGEVARGGA
jgi:hypothetical protein